MQGFLIPKPPPISPSSARTMETDDTELGSPPAGRLVQRSVNLPPESERGEKQPPDVDHDINSSTATTTTTTSTTTGTDTDTGPVCREKRPREEDHHMSGVSVGLDLSKKRRKKTRRKKKKHHLSRLEVQRAKDFIYSSENEQFSVEKLRTMIEDMTEFVDAIWDVYRSEARQKGVNVEEDGWRVMAVMKCLGASGQGRWRDLQLLSRAKSVLVLRSRTMAASTIASVENELGYDADVRSFIVRMLKFWMGEII